MSCDRRVDYRLRVAAAVIASVVAALTTQPMALWLLLAAGAAGVLTAVALNEIGLRAALRRLLAVNAFVLLIWLTLPWTWTGAGLAWSADGAQQALAITLRANAIAAACVALLAGMDALAIARAAAGLGLPAKLARLLLLTVRYVSLLGETRTRLDRAMRARGFRARADGRTLQVTAQLVALLLVHALVRAERVDWAMRARAFSGRFGNAHAGTVPRAHWAWASGTAAALLASASLAWLSP